MMTTRKSYNAALKAKVALEAIKGQHTVNEIASTFSVHPNLVGKWKKQALEQLPELFRDQRHHQAEADADAELQARLYQQIGQLKVELDWLKKKAGLFA